jgi:hypothetical protein
LRERGTDIYKYHPHPILLPSREKVDKPKSKIFSEFAKCVGPKLKSPDPFPGQGFLN